MKTQVANPALADVLDEHTVVGSLWHREGESIRCVACGHRCLIGDDKRGICKVRFSEHGQLKVPFGYVAGLQCDPVEKKPFFHVYPSSDALTFGMMGCDLHCGYCQNWVTSQALRDSAAAVPVRVVSPAQLVEAAQREGARLVVSSYNEPLITAEWAVAVFEQAKAAGLACAFVSNGNATPEVLDFLRPWIVAYKVDLKSFDDRHYRSLGGTLGNITDTIGMIHARGIWLEVVTLVIPGFNDSETELRAAARFLASVSRDIPWHVTAFHKDYRMTDPEATSPRTLMRAAEIGAEEGLRYIYAGNLPGQVGPWENTRCPSCGENVIERIGYLIRTYRLTATGCCPRCQTMLPGIWPGDAATVKTGNDRVAYARRLPRAVAEPPAPRATQSLPLIGQSQTAAGENLSMTTAAPITAQTPEAPSAELTTEQKHALVAAARTLVRTLVLASPGATIDAPLDGLVDRLVAGAFVSLKRGKHLRSCCGMLGKPVPLHAALHQAASRTVADDNRFPPVSPGEINYLEMEIWLLHGPEQVQATGVERAAAVTIGKHGIQVIRGSQHGLFLPSVALDHQWDSRRFLEQVCVKAGMHPTAWHDDATALFTFEGEVLKTPLADREGPQATTQAPGICRPEDTRLYAGFCCDNIGAMLGGTTPSYYFAGAPDGNVNGVILSVQTPRDGGTPETTHFCQLSLRPGLPLQSTLFTLSQHAARLLASMPAEVVPAVRLRVSLLHDPMLHGTALETDLDGFDPRHRAFLVLERNKSGIVFDPSRQPAELLADAIQQARVTIPAGAAVYSLAAIAMAPFTVSTAPTPIQGPAVRAPAVAGQFYPGDPAQLARMVDTLLEGPCQPEPWHAAMVPHAGLMYSGRIAADVLKRIQIPRTVIVLGPKHTALGMEWAVAPHQRWTFPGGRLESDPSLAAELARAIPGLELDAVAHQREHAIEVELPLLARLAPESRVVGIAIGAADLPGCLRFAEGLANVLRSRADRPLLLISSDMNHYANDTETRRLDALALAAVERLDPVELYETVTAHNVSMCGVVPAVIVLQTLKLLGCLHKAKRMGYATSADVTGDPTRVVGYAGMLLG
jgi:AmmeMemoRadiSam system radical SAM enzyme/AmmeMemoRadiSam system protein B/AmmeMemoRadiSam system protein A